MNGILVINKEEGYTSRDVVNIVGKELHTKKVGHTGTLDPLATGTLVLCIGEALKVVELLTQEEKEYIARVRLGYETTTLDREGIITNKSNNKVDINDITKVLSKLTGHIKQEVPAYSAIKVNGKKLYEYARNNIYVNLPVREVDIYKLQLLGDIDEFTGYQEFDIKCRVSKGTYIRSLVRDIGRLLGTYATMIELRRTKQGIFNINNSYTLDDIKNNNYKLISIEDSIPLKKIVVDSNLEFKIKNGQVLDKFFDEDKVFILNESNKLIAIYKTSGNNKVKPYKIFNLE